MCRRILMLCEYASLNGGERSLLAVLDPVRVAGFEVRIAAPPRGPFPETVVERGICLLPLLLHDAHGRRRPIADCRRAIRELILASGVDLVHANSLSTARLSGPVVAELGLPSVGHLRDMLRLNPTVVADLNCHRRLLAVSRATRDWYAAAGLHADKILVLFNGVDLAQFQPRPPTGYLHSELGLRSDVPLIGTIGQIGMRKGLHTWAHAARRVATEMPHAHFVLVGQRHSQKQEAIEYEAELSRLAAIAPLVGHVHFLGLRLDVPRLLNEFTLLVHAARQEPLGRVLLEAAAAGTPVVATNVGGTAEIFPAESGAALLVPPDDPAALTAAILRVLGDVTLRTQLRAGARERAVAAFDAHHAAANLISHYQQVLADRTH
jgi:glycosyltransferase involved in cell wall biosynthesis